MNCVSTERMRTAAARNTMGVKRKDRCAERVARREIAQKTRKRHNDNSLILAADDGPRSGEDQYEVGSDTQHLDIGRHRDM